MSTDIHIQVRDAEGNIISHPAIADLQKRWYNFFAIIGDVRNGIGFAGIETGERFQPISSCRGTEGLPPTIPADIFDGDVCNDPDAFWFGDHSFGWVTLKELLDYPWDAKRQATGIIPLKDYAALRSRGGHPNYWWGDGTENVIDMATADKIIDENIGMSVSPGVRYLWTETNREAVGKTVMDAINALAKAVSDPASTYLIFGFDS